MSRYHGPQGKGAARRTREQKRQEAQQRAADRKAMSADARLMTDLLRLRESRQRGQ